jgi:hypothetical protein
MPSHDEFFSLAEAVGTDLRHLLAATEPRLGRTVTASAGEVPDQERWAAMVQLVTGISNAVIDLARVIDQLAQIAHGDAG